MPNNYETLREYDRLTRLLIAYLKAFISHHERPEYYNLPNLDRAKRLYQEANDFNVTAHRQHKNV